MRRSQLVVLTIGVGMVALVAGFLVGVDYMKEPENAPLHGAVITTTTTTVPPNTSVAASAPATSAISTEGASPAPGKSFQTTPDYSNDPAGVCAVRPCFQPIFDRAGGKRVTDGWPCEYYSEASYTPEAPYCADKTTDQGDVVTVVCQFQDVDVHGSTWWDKVEIPEEHLVEGHGLTPVDGKYYGVAPDRWLGNTGDHGMPCY